MGGAYGGITVKGQSKQKVFKSYMKNNRSKNGWGHGSSGRVQTPILKKNMYIYIYIGSAYSLV
jgi:hypothetical protein